MAPKRKAAEPKAAAPAAAEPPAKKKKGGSQPSAGAPTNLQKAAGGSGQPTIASLLGSRNPELLKVVNPKAPKATVLQPEAGSSSAGSSGEAAAVGFPDMQAFNVPWHGM